MPNGSPADAEFDIAASPVRCRRNLMVCVRMDTPWLAGENETDAEFAGDEAGDDEPPSLDAEDCRNALISEGAGKGGPDRSNEVGVAKGISEVGMAISPFERAEQ